MTTGSEIREIRLTPDRIRAGEEVRATIRYRVRHAEPVLGLEVSAGYTVSPKEIRVPATRTETSVSFLVDRDTGVRGAQRTSGTDPDLCVVTFHLGHGAVMDATLWVDP